MFGSAESLKIRPRSLSLSFGLSTILLVFPRRGLEKRGTAEVVVPGFPGEGSDTALVPSNVVFPFDDRTVFIIEI